jgi:hypothetical protein
MKFTKKGCLLSGCLTPVVAIIFLFIVGILIPSHSRKALPPSAKNIQEHHTGGLHPDFVRFIKAELPEQDLVTYISNLNINVKYDPDIHLHIKSQISKGFGDAPAWWDEPLNLDNCYFNYIPEDEYLQRVKWENGYVYYSVCSW